MVATVTKDPSAVLDYGLDLAPFATQLSTPWLATGETVTSLTVTADAGLVVNSSGIFSNASGAPSSLLVAWLSGGTAGQSYSVHFQFATNQGRTDCRSISIQVQAR